MHLMIRLAQRWRSGPYAESGTPRRDLALTGDLAGCDREESVFFNVHE